MIQPAKFSLYVSRGFEEYRAFRRPCRRSFCPACKAQICIAASVGSDTVAYGSARPDGPAGKPGLQELGLDPVRTHWLGVLQESEYHQVLALSDVHLYLTVPFVLSWSLLKAYSGLCQRRERQLLFERCFGTAGGSLLAIFT